MKTKMRELEKKKIKADKGSRLYVVGRELISKLRITINYHYYPQFARGLMLRFSYN